MAVEGNGQMLNGEDQSPDTLAARDMESNLLAWTLTNNETAYHVGVEPKHFSMPEYGDLWSQMLDVLRDGGSLSPATARAHFPEPFGQYLAILAESAWPITNPAEYGEHLKAEWQRRQARMLAEELIDCTQDRGLSISAVVSQACKELANTMEVRNLASAEDVAGNILRDLDKPIHVFPTGLECVDRITMGGLQAGMFYGLGGRYKAGKSFMLTTLSYNLLNQCKHLYLTLESSKEQLYKRMLARCMGANTNEFIMRTNHENPEFRGKVETAQANLKADGLLMQTVPRVDLDGLRSIIEQAVVKHKIRGAFVDYIQLVAGDPRVSKALHFEDVAQTLSELTREFGIWIVAAAQMNQEGNVRWGEGLLMACDMALVLNKCSETEPGIEPGDMWLEMKASRYTAVNDAGSGDQPALRLDKLIGPHFRSL